MNAPDRGQRLLFDRANEPSPPTPAELRKIAMDEGSGARAEYARKVSIGLESYKNAIEFVDALVARAARTKKPGGLWVLGDGGVGKSFILEAVLKRYAPRNETFAGNCPVLSLSFNGRPAESDILLSLILQLGQDPSLLHYQNNSDLFAIFLDAQAACGSRAILFDEAQHLWLAVSAKRIADRAGGHLGDFLKRLYDESGLAFVFSGTKGLAGLIDTDKQAATRWPGKIRLETFGFDERFIGMLAALDNALPMEEPSGLSDLEMAKKLFDATQGNFRLIKNLIAEAVFLAANAKSPKVTMEFLGRAHFLTFCDEINPFTPS